MLAGIGKGKVEMDQVKLVQEMFECELPLLTIFRQ